MTYLWSLPGGPNAEEATKEWLKAHYPCLKGYESRPDRNEAPRFLRRIDRRGIRFTHPWSINDTNIENYSDQVYYCPEWQSVVKAIEDIDRTG